MYGVFQETIDDKIIQKKLPPLMEGVDLVIGFNFHGPVKKMAFGLADKEKEINRIVDFIITHGWSKGYFKK